MFTVLFFDLLISDQCNQAPAVFYYKFLLCYAVDSSALRKFGFLISVIKPQQYFITSVYE